MPGFRYQMTSMVPERLDQLTAVGRLTPRPRSGRNDNSPTSVPGNAINKSPSPL